MRMFTKMGVTIASAGLPVLLWAGAAGAQQSPSQSQSQSQSQSTFQTVPTTLSTGGTGGTGGTLARTGAEDLLPLVVGGAALAGAVTVRRGLRRRPLG